MICQSWIAVTALLIWRSHLLPILLSAVQHGGGVGVDSLSGSGTVPGPAYLQDSLARPCSVKQCSSTNTTQSVLR